MDIQEVMNKDAETGDAVKAFIKASARFLEVLSKHNINLEVNDPGAGAIDYNAPASAAYKKTYRPIEAAEIIQANKEMSEAISGEQWVKGFLMCVKLMLLFGRP